MGVRKPQNRTHPWFCEYRLHGQTHIKRYYGSYDAARAALEDHQSDAAWCALRRNPNYIHPRAIDVDELTVEWMRKLTLQAMMR